jgi:hypothetical protein
MGGAESVATRWNVDVAVNVSAQPVKLLMLGTGDGGKSTLLKQLIELFSRPMTREERDSWLRSILLTTFWAMKAMIEHVEQRGIEAW